MTVLGLGTIEAAMLCNGEMADKNIEEIRKNNVDRIVRYVKIAKPSFTVENGTSSKRTLKRLLNSGNHYAIDGEGLSRFGGISEIVCQKSWIYKPSNALSAKKKNYTIYIIAAVIGLLVALGLFFGLYYGLKGRKSADKPDMREIYNGDELEAISAELKAILDDEARLLENNPVYRGMTVENFKNYLRDTFIPIVKRTQTFTKQLMKENEVKNEGYNTVDGKLKAEETAHGLTKAKLEKVQSELETKENELT